MSTKGYFYIVEADAPDHVVWHDAYQSPWFTREYDAYTDYYDDFERWVRIGLGEVFFRQDAKTLDEMEMFRLSNVIPENAIELMREWMDAYHTDKPFTPIEEGGNAFWVYANYTRETLPPGARPDTPEFRESVFTFLHKAIGKRLVVKVE